MHLHVLGICGTFMAGLAVMARQLGHRVTGSDAQVYPPMSTQLEAAGIPIQEGYHAEHLVPAPDIVVVGNALSRGNPAVEYCLDRGLAYTSGPQWLFEQVLRGRWVLAVAGTHGKTTTASLLAWILEHAGLAPGFLIGGVPENFGVSARLGTAPFFVVEADEYDTAFFDKRSKFVHYRPRTLVLNNLEYDHADIFPDLAAIRLQFHHLVRTVPSSGVLIAPESDPNIAELLAMGRWSTLETFGSGAARWHARSLAPDGSRFEVYWEDRLAGRVEWSLIGEHNLHNALAAIAAARHAGVPAELACSALREFHNVKRRLERHGEAGGVTVFDDFAHHPTAIAATIAALRKRVGEARILAVIEPRSNTMRLGVHRDTLAPAVAQADQAFFYLPPDLTWDLTVVARQLSPPGQIHGSIDELVSAVVAHARPGDQVLVMSNGAFGGIHDKLLEALAR